jgi:CBS domain-containing protein
MNGRERSMAKSVGDVMTDVVRYAEPSQSLVEAARAMREEDVGSLPVAEDGRLVGVLTDRDIVTRAVAEGIDPAAITVAEVASRELITVSPDRDLHEALRLMARHQVRRLPVVSGQRLVGILAQADIATLADTESAAQTIAEISEPSTGDRS